jgi:hypothetical protein
MKSKKLMLALVMATLMAMPLVSAFAVGPGDPDTTVAVTDASTNIGAEATSEITVSIVNDMTDPIELRGVEVHLTFDPAIVEVVSVTPSAALFDGTLQIGQNQFDNAVGTIDFAVAQSNGTPVFNATDAAIATITWRGLASGQTTVAVAANTLMSDPEGYAITVDFSVPGTVVVSEAVGCIIGSVQLQGRYDHDGASVLVTEADGTPVAETFTDIAGNFELQNLAPGTYEVYARMYGYLDSFKGSGVQVVAGGECTDIGATKLLGGDVAPQDPEPNNAIDISDITYIAFRFRGADMTADVNGDVVVNILDLTMAAANFLRTGPTPWSMTP